MSLKDIHKIKKDYLAIGTFSGCGGSSTGFKMAGFNVLLAVEFIDIARETYEINHPDTVVTGSDIRKLDPAKIMSHFGIKKYQLDTLEGSPPCKSYSTAGAISDNWGAEVLYSEGVKQRTDDLFDEYIRFVEAFRPKTFVAENVSGLVKGDSRGVFVEIMEKFRALGYKVSAPLLNSAWLGVPQNRERIIFIGVREDLKIDPPRIFPLHEICTVSESLDHISYIKATHKGHLKYVPASVPQPTITVADAISYETARFSSGGFVETVAGERRKYSIEELKVICGFPKDYKLIGTFEQQWERLGRAVPPMMMYHVAKAVREQVLDVYYARKGAKPGAKIK